MYPLFTVIIPLYEKYKDLNYEAIDSVINQINAPSYEVILVLSKSDLIIDLQKYHINSKIKIVLADVSSLVSKRNTALKYIKGEYVVFLDCDDVLNLNFLKRSMDIIIKYKDVDLIVFDYTRTSNFFFSSHKTEIPISSSFYQGDAYLNQVYSKFLDPRKNNLFFMDSVWAKVFKAKFIIEKKLSFKKLRAEDFIFVNEYLQYSRSIYYDNFLSYYWRINYGSLMSNDFWFETTHLFIEEFYDIISKVNGLKRKLIYRYISFFLPEIIIYVSMKSLSVKLKTELLIKLIPKNSTFFKAITSKIFIYDNFFWNIIAFFISIKFYSFAVIFGNFRKTAKKWY
jgi:glycosyltransferase involved in cell wall biosynthesis